jgi:hypothetical protein
MLEELGDLTLVSIGLCCFAGLLNPTSFKLRPVEDRFGLGYSSVACGTNKDPLMFGEPGVRGELAPESEGELSADMEKEGWR